jgi:hypothetical protein
MVVTNEWKSIYLNDPNFSHCKLYLVMSKVRSLNNLFIAIVAELKETTHNVVYKEIFKAW